MSHEVNLPFRRGSTFYEEADSTDISNTDIDSLALEGKVYEVPDTVHGTGLTVKLRVVRNGTGSGYTVVKGNGFEFVAGKVLREVDSLAETTEFGRIIDDAYAVGKVIADDDLFYVIEEGPVDGLSQAAYSAGAALMFHTGSKQATAVEGAYVIGIADEAAGGADENKRIIVGPTGKTLTA